MPAQVIKQARTVNTRWCTCRHTSAQCQFATIVREDSSGNAPAKPQSCMVSRQSHCKIHAAGLQGIVCLDSVDADTHTASQCPL
jgi:hypothetical protein